MAWMVFFPVVGILFFIFGSIVAIWFVIHVEKGFRFSGIKSAIAIILLSVFFGFGIEFILIASGAMG
jgi:hypothetical protein